MNENIQNLIQACEWFPSHFLIFSENVYNHFVYYSHIGSVVPTLAIGIYILINSRKEPASKNLFFSILFFSLWIFCNLVIWATPNPSHTLFFWSLINLFEPLVYFFMFRFAYAMLYKKDLSLGWQVISSIPLLPTIILASTNFAILGYNLADCDRNAVEGITAFYGYGIEILYALLIVGMIIWAAIKVIDRKEKTKIILLGIAISAFLFSFSFGNIASSLLVGYDNWNLELMGLFGVPVFTAMIAFLIARYQTFNIRLLGAQALVIALAVLIGSSLLVNDLFYSKIVTGITLVFIIILGYFLIKSVRKEVSHREQLESLTRILSHDVKGMLGNNRTMFIEMLGTDYGQVPAEMRPLVERSLSDTNKSMDRLMNILKARSEKRYVMAPFEMKKVVADIMNDIKPDADKKGISMTLEAPETSYMVVGDKEWIGGQVIKNIIDNSVKYTPKGNIAVELSRVGNKISFSVKDTGVGIIPEDMARLFTEAGHGKDSAKVNAQSTGYGLFIAKQVVEGHGGKIWAQSDGQDKGSQFYVELLAQV